MRAGLLSSRGVPRFGEPALQGQDALQHGVPLAAAVVAVGEAHGVVVGEAFGELGQRHRFVAGELEEDARHRAPTRSTNVASAASSALPLAWRRSRKRGRPSRSDVSRAFGGGALWSGSSSLMAGAGA